jgi:CspA family cold shock protein
MIYLGTPWMDCRVPYAPVRKILAICRASGLDFCVGRSPTASRPQNARAAEWLMFWDRPCITAEVGSQSRAWENLEDCMPTGKIKMFDEGRGFGFIKPDDGDVDVFFHVSALRDGAEVNQGKAVKFEIGVDPKSGKTKAVSVDLT